MVVIIMLVFRVLICLVYVVLVVVFPVLNSICHQRIHGGMRPPMEGAIVLHR